MSHNGIDRIFTLFQDVFGDGQIPYPKREFLTDDDNDGGGGGDKNDPKHARAAAGQHTKQFAFGAQKNHSFAWRAN